LCLYVSNIDERLLVFVGAVRFGADINVLHNALHFLIERHKCQSPFRRATNGPLPESFWLILGSKVVTHLEFKYRRASVGHFGIARWKAWRNHGCQSATIIEFKISEIPS
jgi:hypothetical protein